MGSEVSIPGSARIIAAMLMLYLRAGSSAPAGVAASAHGASAMAIAASARPSRAVIGPVLSTGVAPSRPNPAREDFTRDKPMQHDSLGPSLLLLCLAPLQELLEKPLLLGCIVGSRACGLLPRQDCIDPLRGRRRRRGLAGYFVQPILGGRKLLPAFQIGC